MVLEKNIERKSALLRHYFDDVLFKDVALRYSVRDVKTLRAMAVHLLTQTASLVSFHRLSKTFGVSLDLVRAYCSHLEESFLLKLIDQYSLKATERRRNPQKVYAGDLGLRNAVCISGSDDLGRRAETAVFQKLQRVEGVEVFHWKGAGEVDFLVRKGGKVSDLIQVAYQGLDKEEVREREIGPLQEAHKSYQKAGRRIVVARPPKGSASGIPKGVEVAPMWRFLSSSRCGA